MQRGTKREIELMGFGVLADKDKYSRYLIHADRILIIRLENRKNVLKREYLVNPCAEIAKKKFPKPTPFGEKIPEEEKKLCTEFARFIKEECKVKYLYGIGITYFLRIAFDRIGQHYNNTATPPGKQIDIFIDSRELAGFPR
jgi:hypothetical protein